MLVGDGAEIWLPMAWIVNGKEEGGESWEI